MSSSMLCCVQQMTFKRLGALSRWCLAYRARSDVLCFTIQRSDRFVQRRAQGGLMCEHAHTACSLPRIVS